MALNRQNGGIVTPTRFATEPVTLRIAQEGDCPAICPLYWAFHEHHARYVPDRVSSPGPLDDYDCGAVEETLRQLVVSEQADLVVAGSTTGVLGFAEVHLRWDEGQPGRIVHQYGHITALYVAEPLRRQGLGASLVQVAEQWALQRGATEIRLEVWQYPEGPLRFYEQLDYRTAWRTMVKPL
jgi:diamine N-acetyltransferase